MIKTAQLAGNSRTEEFIPEVKIISSTQNPVGLIGSIWYGSRQADEVSVENLQSIYDDPDGEWSTDKYRTARQLVNAFPQYYGVPEDEIDLDNLDRQKVRNLLIKLVQICLKANLPVSESVALTIQVDNASVAWREQLVRCLSGDTKIKLLDGSIKSIKELHDSNKKDFYVYSFNPESKMIVPGLCKGVMKTKVEVPVKITFDDGSSVVCTKDHRFLTVDGDYEYAENLLGKSVEPIYTEVSENGYELIFQKGLNRNQYTHRMVANNLLAEDLKLVYNPVVHHTDKNKFNNDPSNLKVITFKEHTDIHRFTTESMKELWANDDGSFRKKASENATKTMNEYWKDPEKVDAHKERTRKLMIKQNKDPEFREKANEGIRNWFKDPENRAKHAERQKTRDMSWINDEFRARKSEHSKKYIEEHPDYKQKLVNQLEEYRKTHPEEVKASIDKFKRGRWVDLTEEEYKAQIAQQAEWMRERMSRPESQHKSRMGKIAASIRAAMSISDDVTIDNYQKLARKAGKKPTTIYTPKVLLKLFDSWENAYEYAKNWNHKVVKVEQLEEEIQLYDLEVSGFDNFGIYLENSDSMVIAHNSKFSSYFMQTSRIADLSKMDVNRAHSIEMIAGKEGVDIYNDAVNTIRRAYYKLGKMGVPQEDIRLQPQMNTHRVYWMTTLRALLTTMSNRCGYIAQASLWTPITAGVISELRRLNLMDVLGEFLGNPPVKIAYESDYDAHYVSDYDLKADNEDRILGKDPLPVDPLYLAYIHESMPEHTDIAHYDYLKSMFIQVWNDKYLNILGWNRDDPDQIGIYDRPRSFFKKVSSNEELGIISDNKYYYKQVVERAMNLSESHEDGSSLNK